ncbi:MAG: hypothetical protein R3A13_08140 [Bdellovibrionota bacterium]
MISDLPDNSEADLYMDALEKTMSYVEDQEIDFLFYIAGADPYIEDTLGRLNISREGLASRDKRVLSYAYENEIPVVVVFGGGYCETISKTVEINLETIEIARSIYDYKFELNNVAAV